MRRLHCFHHEQWRTAEAAQVDSTVMYSTQGPCIYSTIYPSSSQKHVLCIELICWAGVKLCREQCVTGYFHISNSHSCNLTVCDLIFELQWAAFHCVPVPACVQWLYNLASVWRKSDGEGGSWLTQRPGREVAWLGKGIGMKLWLPGSACEAEHQRGGGAAVESRCRLALILLAASVMGPLNYYGQPVFGVCVWRGVNCMDEWTLTTLSALASFSLGPLLPPFISFV